MGWIGWVGIKSVCDAMTVSRCGVFCSFVPYRYRMIDAFDRWLVVGSLLTDVCA